METKIRGTDPFDKDLSEQIKKTHEGMAHWAGSGPAGATCRMCKHWNYRGYKKDPGFGRPELKDATCGRFISMCARSKGLPIPHNADACKYFEEFPQHTERRQIYKPRRKSEAAQ